MACRFHKSIADISNSIEDIYKYTYLKISTIPLEISTIHLEISTIHLEISPNTSYLEIISNSIADICNSIKVTK